MLSLLVHHQAAIVEELHLAQVAIFQQGFWLRWNPHLLCHCLYCVETCDDGILSIFWNVILAFAVPLFVQI